MQYRRSKVPGATYFFTIVTYDRQEILCIPHNVEVLRKAFKTVMQHHPFTIEAFVLLPNHIHCIWKLPENDADFSNRWRLIKSNFTRKCISPYNVEIPESRKKKGEKVIWQRRFWEHLIRDDRDFKNHADYIHYNPVKHGLVTEPRSWEYSSFSRFVQAGEYDLEWGSGTPIKFDQTIGYE